MGWCTSAPARLTPREAQTWFITRGSSPGPAMVKLGLLPHSLNLNLREGKKVDYLGDEPLIQ